MARGNSASSTSTPFTSRVSIRPRPDGQGKRLAMPSEQCRIVGGFNPPPARWPGETGGAAELRRARRFQSAPGPMARGNHVDQDGARPAFRFQSAPGPMARGNRQMVTILGVRYVSIRPRPDGQGKRDTAPRLPGCRRVSIRPRPDGQGKRVADSRQSQVPKASFNPPPARWPGETR